ncbi:hypothetical protein J1N35_029121 [Gossypium stocksii]|uniref:Uncharacterized protein n=1 Tax=Gossypium stocksii TaxID=47602 RepID=A0A9D3ZSS0_9ROSI|nr:hypothetical protein J1N35_029121 [Gossypium stocksii]
MLQDRIHNPYSGWDIHLSGSMFNTGNTYWGLASLLVVGNPHLIEDVLKCTRQGMMYSLRCPLVRGPPTLQMLVSRMMSAMWIHPKSSMPMVHYFLN